MAEILLFAGKNMVFVLPMLLINIKLASEISKIISHTFRAAVSEASGGRCADQNNMNERHDKNAGTGFSAGNALHHIREKIKKNIEKSEYAKKSDAITFFALRYVLPGFVFVLTWMLNYPSIYRAIASSLLIFAVTEYLNRSKKKRRKLIFQKNAYKIYKYLHNQISSGIKVTEAVKTMYAVIEDKELREHLLRLAAGYELTLDIETCLEEFTGKFDSDDASALCSAIKLGIDTGDNSELLARQEEIMFRKYFNFIQAETEACRGKSAAAAALFAVIIVIMIAMPMIKSVTESMNIIFVN